MYEGLQGYCCMYLGASEGQILGAMQCTALGTFKLGIKIYLLLVYSDLNTGTRF